MAGKSRAICASVLLSSVISAWAQQHGLRASRAASTAEEAELQLRSQLMTVLGHGDESSTERLGQLQEDMLPMYKALPKKSDGGLDYGVARYALHRFFVQHHGWHVKGLEATGAEKWGDASPTAMFENRVPDYVLRLVEQRLAGRLGLEELAVLAATLEDLVHSEAIQLASSAFAAQNLSSQAQLSEELEELVVKTYLLFHIKPNQNYTKMTTDRINHILGKAPKFLTGWEDTLLWVQDLQLGMRYQEYSLQSPFVRTDALRRDFDSIVRLVEEIGEGYGRFQNIECRGIKNALLDLEDGMSGRVRLSRFYKPSLDSEQGTSPHFNESPEYLRHLGALDESDPKRPSVIVPNYLSSRANCLASSGFYAVCCIDECEVLMAHLELEIATPAAPPQLLAAVISTLGSDTVSAPRLLSAPMRRRLDSIAEHHGGTVPIHGRLFAQWMHHAFPNECPYPHAPGTAAAPLTPLQWMRGDLSSKRSPRATREDMESVVEADLQANSSNTSTAFNVDVDTAVLLPWTEEEELVTMPASESSARSWSAVSFGVRLLVLALTLTSAVLGLLRMLRAPVATLPMHNKSGKSAAWVFPLARTAKPHFV